MVPHKIVFIYFFVPVLFLCFIFREKESVSCRRGLGGFHEQVVSIMLLPKRKEKRKGRKGEEMSRKKGSQ